MGAGIWLTLSWKVPTIDLLWNYSLLKKKSQNMVLFMRFFFFFFLIATKSCTLGLWYQDGANFPFPLIFQVGLGEKEMEAKDSPSRECEEHRRIFQPGLSNGFTIPLRENQALSWGEEIA